MTDVQLERPVRISPSMLEAMLAGPFTGTQLRVVLALLAHIHRARAHPVSVSQSALAATAGVPVAGAFRAALKALRRAGIIRVAAPARGRRSATYMIGREAEWRIRHAA